MTVLEPIESETLSWRTHSRRILGGIVKGLHRATLQGGFGQILHYPHPYKQQHKGAVYEARLNLHDFVLMGLKRSLHRSHYMLHVRPLLPSAASHAQHHYPQRLKAARVHLKKSQNQRLETLESLLNQDSSLLTNQTSSTLQITDIAPMTKRRMKKSFELDSIRLCKNMSEYWTASAC